MTSQGEEFSDFVRELTEVQKDLRHFVGYLMGGQSEVQDVVQEVNLLLWEKREEFEAGTNFKAWSFAVARFKVLSKRRKMKRQGVQVFDEGLIDRLADEWEQDPAQQESLMGALEKCVSRLGKEDVHLLRERYAGHGNVGKLAEQLGRTAVSLRARLFRLRAALKQCVLNEVGEGGGL